MPLSTSPGILGSHSSSPLCSGMASGIIQFSFYPPFLPPPEGMSQFTVWRQLCVLSQDKPIVVSLKASGSGYSDFRPMLSWTPGESCLAVVIRIHNAYVAQTAVDYSRFTQHKSLSKLPDFSSDFYKGWWHIFLSRTCFDRETYWNQLTYEVESHNWPEI